MFVSRIAAVLDRLHILAYDSCKHDRERLILKDNSLAAFQQLSCTVLACRHQRLFIRRYNAYAHGNSSFPVK